MYLLGRQRRTICAILVLLFITIPLSGCLSLVAGREMMEGARGEPQVRQSSTTFTLDHDFILDGTLLPIDQVQESLTDQILIDYTVSEIRLVYKVILNLDETIPQNFDPRYVTIELFWCDDGGLNCDEDVPVFSETFVGSEEDDISIDRDETQFEDGLWRLQVEGVGFGTDTGIAGETRDGWRLTATVYRPCLSFPENLDECTPTVDLA